MSYLDSLTSQNVLSKEACRTRITSTNLPGGAIHLLYPLKSCCRDSQCLSEPGEFRSALQAFHIFRKESSKLTSKALLSMLYLNQLPSQAIPASIAHSSSVQWRCTEHVCTSHCERPPQLPTASGCLVWGRFLFSLAWYFFALKRHVC